MKKKGNKRKQLKVIVLNVYREDKKGTVLQMKNVSQM